MIPYQLENVHSHIEKYFGRFCSLLGPGNRRYIQTLLVLTRAFLQVLLDDKNVNCLNTCPDAERSAGEKHTFDSSMAINDFLFSLNIDNINLIKLLQYIKESNIMHKVDLCPYYLFLFCETMSLVLFLFYFSQFYGHN